MKRLGLALLSATLFACGAQRPRPAPVPVGTRPVSVRHSSGLEVATLRRPMGERVWLALYVDAGSRDADPPQVATLAALIASHAGVRARVSPDETELAIDCRRAELARCAQTLASALATREASRDALALAMRELVRRRRVAAQDDGREADRVALEALLGPGAGPLGHAEADDAADRDLVRRFLEANYGPSRALLVAVGDVDEGDVDEAAEVFARTPAAFDGAPARPAPREGSAAAIEGRGLFVAAALASPTLERAAAVGRALTDPLIGDPALWVQVFPLRGVAVTLVRTDGEGEPLERARGLVAALGAGARDADESPAADGEIRMGVGGNPIHQARAFAADWTARLDSRADSNDAPAIAVSVVSPTPPSADALSTAWTEGLAGSQVTIEGDSDAASASVGGARIAVRRTPGAARVAVALSFLGGAYEEPPAMHGRGLLLAHLMSERCGLDGGRLSERLRAVGGRATAVVESERLGVVFDLPATQWRMAIDLAARCALRPPSAATDVDGVRTSLLAHRGAAEGLAERTSRLLAPDHPGRIAPEGSGVALARLTLGELAAAHERLAVRARLRAAVVGDVPADAATQRLARWFRTLPEGAAPTAVATWSEAESDPLANPETRDDVPRLLLCLRVPVGAAERAEGVRRLARDLGRRLAGDHATLEVTAGGSDSHGSWLAIELAVTRETLDAMPARVAVALREARDPANSEDPDPSSPATLAWSMTVTEASSAPLSTIVAALKRAAPILQIRGVGRSPTLRRLDP